MVQNLTAGMKAECNSYEYQWSSYILNHLDLYIIPLLNPDGKVRMEREQQYCWRNNGIGVDLNRNADWEFNGPGSSKEKDHEEYNGETPFSQTETRYFKELAEKNKFDAYISIHSGEQQLFIPYVDTKSKEQRRRHWNTDKQLALSQRVLDKSNGWFRNHGIGWEMNSYAADGTLYDW